MPGLGGWFIAGFRMELEVADDEDGESPSSFTTRTTGDRTTIWFQGTKTVRVIGLKGLLWNWSVTAPPPFTRMSNLLVEGD